MDSPKKYGKNYVQLVCTKRVDNQTNYLIYTRDIEPFLGCSGFPSGKVDWGEKVLDTASRELFEETGLSGEPEIVAMIHYLFRNNKKEIVQDEFMYVCRIDEPQGQLISSEEGKNYWVPEGDLKTTLVKPFVPIENYLRIVEIIKGNSKEVRFFEIESETQDY